jgi:hypothetical protein
MAYQPTVTKGRDRGYQLNPVKVGLVARPQDWKWSSWNEYAGMNATEQERRCGLIIDRVRLPAEVSTRI